jgi:CheY-like chemotaxis protein
MTTILLIEDNAPLRKNLREMLSLEGYEVFAAGDGREGLRLAREQKPSLILCDIMLPSMDGWEILASLRSDPGTAALPFIFLTAKGELPDIRSGMNLGADDYLTKPVARPPLRELITTRETRTFPQRS